MTLKQFQTIWCLNNKASKIIFYLLSVILNGSKKNPCFHRTISIQIDSPLPQDDTQAVSRQSDVELQNKSLQISYSPLLSVILNGLKIKVPVPQNNFNSDWQSTTQDDTQAVSRQSDVNYIIKALQISYSLSVCDLNGSKKKSLFPQTISIQIDSPLPQDDTQAVSRQSDVFIK